MFFKNHSCGQKLCANCKTYFSESDNHLCRLMRTTFKTEANSLAFLSMEFLHEDKQSLVSYETPNVVTLLKETKPLTGVFDLFQMSEFEKLKVSYNHFKSSYQRRNLIPSFQEKVNIPEVFKDKIKSFTDYPGNRSCIEMLICVIINWTDTIIICNDNEGYIFEALIKALLKSNIFFKSLVHNKKYFEISIEEIRLRVLNFSNYISGNENHLGELFGLNHSPIFFPQQLNTTFNYEFNGEIPKLDCFLTGFESPDLCSKIRVFIEDYSGNWNFKKEISSFSKQKAEILCKSTLAFLQEFYLFQLDIHSVIPDDNLNKSKILCSFQSNLSTFSGFIYSLFKGLFLNLNEIFSVKNEYYVPSIKVSQTEYEFCKYLEL